MAKLIRSDEPQPYELIARREVTHDTREFRFRLPEGARLDFKPGYCVTIATEIDGEEVERPYTPCFPPWVEGEFGLTIKRYEDGKVSKYVHDDVEVGDEVMIAGPWESGCYEEGMAGKIGLVAGGTGITPMLSIIRTIMERGDDVDLHLLFANKEERDIICREEFEEYAEKSDRFHPTFAVEEPGSNWKGEKGRVTRDMMERALPAAGDDTVVFLCGPPPMVSGLQSELYELGHSGKKIILP